MKNSELDEILKSTRVPERSAEYWDQFAERVVGRLRGRPRRPESLEPGSADNTPVRAPSSGAPWLQPLAYLFGGRRFVPVFAASVAAIALICLAAGFAFGFWKGRHSATSDQQFAEAQKYFREIQALFPNQLQAIVFDQQGTRLELAEQPNVPASPPLYVKISGPDGTRRFVTFSGQQIRVNRELCDVLLDHRGNVLLVGHNIVWSSSKPGEKPASYQIEAKLLGATS